MPLSSEDTVPLTRARATLTQLVEEIQSEHSEKIITKRGKSCAALIHPERLDHYHRLEREHIHLSLLAEAIRGLADLRRGKTLPFAKLKSRHSR